MPLHGPNADDLRKLAAETTQIVNQKFLITTVTITVFGVLSAQIITTQQMADADARTLGWPGFVGPILLNLMLLVLFFYSTILAGMLRVITTYLVETGASSWEVDWAAYRRRGHIGYTRAQAVVFLFLSTAATAFPCVFALVRACSLQPRAGLAAHAIIGVATIAAIISLGLVGWPDLEASPDRRWRALRDGEPEPRAPASPPVALDHGGARPLTHPARTPAGATAPPSRRSPQAS